MVVSTEAFYTPQTVSEQPIAEADQPGRSLHVKCITVVVNVPSQSITEAYGNCSSRRNQWKVTWLEVGSCNPWHMMYRACHRSSKMEESGCHSLRRIISSVVTTSDQVCTLKQNLSTRCSDDDAVPGENHLPTKLVGISMIARSGRQIQNRMLGVQRTDEASPLHGCMGRSHWLCSTNIQAASRLRNPYSLWLSATTNTLDIRVADGDRKSAVRTGFMTTCEDTITDSPTGYLHSNQNLQSSYAGVHSNHIHALSHDAWTSCMV
ncbi:hypothetical protein EDC04DRAFT_2780447 [Pisolithus marmoratus]|nr:hypothetical protein EDC04DRAFT_2780447 [Pisolithus marmoratus]